MSSQSTSILGELYDKFSEFGMWKTKIFFWIALFITIILVIYGTKIYFTDQSNLIDTLGQINQIYNVRTISSRKNPKNKEESINIYNYQLSVIYQVNGEPYKRQGNIEVSSTKKLSQGAPIELTYDITKPESISAKVIRNKKIATMMSLFGVILIAITGFSYLLSKTFKIYAAAEGVGTIANVISAPFRY